ncbi:MAG: hypothetical protein KJ606_06955 [Chloroflexi bacterium]|nr:hypothetical protein [Chloroflexota bacterium]
MSNRRFSILILAATLFVVTAACICIPYVPFTPQPSTPTGLPLVMVAPSATIMVAPSATIIETATQTASPTPQIVCPSLLSEMLIASEGDGSHARTYGRKLPTIHEEQTLVIYRVEGGQLTGSTLSAIPAKLRPYQQDTATHEAIWDYFTTIIPANQREIVNQYVIFTDGQYNILAAVEQDGYDPARWSLGVDILDSADRKALGATLLHEFGHLLTLNTSQVVIEMNLHDNPDDAQAAAACQQYFLPSRCCADEGCSQSNSYINHFHRVFWTAIYAEWEQIKAIEDQDEYDRRLYDFYEAYQRQFVTEYTATSPEEDIAESWMFFILEPKPAGDTIAEQKILFFYDWPELVQLRGEIISRVCTYFNQP